jgi:hypothetical protein
MRLYMLRYASGRAYRTANGEYVYFNSKDEAKRQRDALNRAVTGEKAVVSLGPDHKRWRSGRTA